MSLVGSVGLGGPVGPLGPMCLVCPVGLVGQSAEGCIFGPVHATVQCAMHTHDNPLFIH